MELRKVKMEDMKACHLNNGTLVPSIAFGTGTRSPEVKNAILCAIKVGYRHFDTANIYGTEASLGEALAEAFSSGLVKREEVFVTTKLWCTDHHEVLAALKSSLEKLKLDYVDLYLVHWPVKLKKTAKLFMLKEEDFLPLDLRATWEGMENCVELGLTKAIGVSNFSVRHLKDLLLYAKLHPAVNQVEMHPAWQQRRLKEYCDSVNIKVAAWSPLGGMTKKIGTTYEIDKPIIVEIAKKYGKTSAQVSLRWNLERGNIVVLKSYNECRLSENLNIFDFKLTQEDHAKIMEIKQERVFDAAAFCNESTSPYKTPFDFWDGDI